MRAGGRLGRCGRPAGRQPGCHDRLHTLAKSRSSARLIDLLWDSTEAYRALYYGLPGEAAAADRAHREIIAAVAARDVDAVVRLQDDTRERALERLRGTLWGEANGLPPQVTQGA